jgi:hypothetical protein
MVQFVQWFAVIWLILTACAIIAAVPHALKVLERGRTTNSGELLVISWPVIMVGLSIPAVVALLIIWFDMWGDTVMAKMLYGESASIDMVHRDSTRSMKRQASRMARDAGLVAPPQGILEQLGLRAKKQEETEEEPEEAKQYPIPPPVGADQGSED